MSTDNRPCGRQQSEAFKSLQPTSSYRAYPLASAPPAPRVWLPAPRKVPQVLPGETLLNLKQFRGCTGKAAGAEFPRRPRLMALSAATVLLPSLLAGTAQGYRVCKNRIARVTELASALETPDQTEGHCSVDGRSLHVVLGERQRPSDVGQRLWQELRGIGCGHARGRCHGKSG